MSVLQAFERSCMLEAAGIKKLQARQASKKRKASRIQKEGNPGQPVSQETAV